MYPVCAWEKVLDQYGKWMLWGPVKSSRKITKWPTPKISQSVLGAYFVFPLIGKRNCAHFEFPLIGKRNCAHFFSKARAPGPTPHSLSSVFVALMHCICARIGHFCAGMYCIYWHLSLLHWNGLNLCWHFLLLCWNICAHWTLLYWNVLHLNWLVLQCTAFVLAFVAFVLESIAFLLPLVAFVLKCIAFVLAGRYWQVSSLGFCAGMDCICARIFVAFVRLSTAFVLAFVAFVLECMESWSSQFFPSGKSSLSSSSDQWPQLSDTSPFSFFLGISRS